MTSFITITIAAAAARRVVGRHADAGMADMGIAFRAAEHAKRIEQPGNPNRGSPE